MATKEQLNKVKFEQPEKLQKIKIVDKSTRKTEAIQCCCFENRQLHKKN